MNETVVVLGASSNPERYSNKAVKMLTENGHSVIPVHPKEQVVEGFPVKVSLMDVDEKIDTITVYVNPSLSTPLKDAMLALQPKRVIFNPGTENSTVADYLANSGVEVVEACTLVMLRTEQF